MQQQMIEPQQPGRLVATYRLRCAMYDTAMELARDIAREQTLEVPPGIVGDVLEERLLGRVDDLTARPEGSFDAKVSYALEVTGTDLLQVINVAYGNVSLMNGVRLVDLTLPDEVLEALPGPRYGIEGLREMVGAEGWATDGQRRDQARGADQSGVGQPGGDFRARRSGHDQGRSRIGGSELGTVLGQGDGSCRRSGRGECSDGRTYHILSQRHRTRGSTRRTTGARSRGGMFGRHGVPELDGSRRFA